MMRCRNQLFFVSYLQEEISFRLQYQGNLCRVHLHISTWWTRLETWTGAVVEVELWMVWLAYFN